MELIKYISQQSKVSREGLKEIDESFKTETHKKGEILLLPDNRSQKMIFVESGLLRSYYQMEDKVITFLFIPENTVTMPLESIFYNKPDPYGWEVIQDCVIRSIHYDNAIKLLDAIPGFERFLLGESFKALKLMADKLYALQFQIAEERYKNMLTTYPDILLNAPLGHVASYLGITQQTLSVIRGKMT